MWVLCTCAPGEPSNPWLETNAKGAAQHLRQPWRSTTGASNGDSLLSDAIAT